MVRPPPFMGPTAQALRLDSVNLALPNSRGTT
jgi:hypothetical protein